MTASRQKRVQYKAMSLEESTRIWLYDVGGIRRVDKPNVLEEMPINS